MKLELIDVFNSNGAAMDFEGDMEIEDTMSVNFDGPAHIKGRAENIGGQVEISAKVTAKIATNCARCMKEIFKDVDFEFTETVAGKDAEVEDADDVIILDSSEVDVADLALNNFITVSPMKYLCKEDCKGLCPHCGADRNEVSCGCDGDEIDPRLDVLNDLFK